MKESKVLLVGGIALGITFIFGMGMQILLVLNVVDNNSIWGPIFKSIDSWV